MLLWPGIALRLAPRQWSLNELSSAYPRLSCVAQTALMPQHPKTQGSDSPEELLSLDEVWNTLLISALTPWVITYSVFIYSPRWQSGSDLECGARHCTLAGWLIVLTIVVCLDSFSEDGTSYSTN